MDVRTEWLEKIIRALISIIEHCRDLTAFGEERNLYDKNIEMAREWLNRIEACDYQEVVETILSPYTDKYFGDYWKREPWGRLEMEASNKLQLAIENKLAE